MLINDIYWHDSLILGVRINPEKDVIEMKVFHPEDWESNTYVEKTIVFENAYGYKEFQGPFHGSPTILSTCVVGRNGRWSQLKIETNAGYCEVYCENVFVK